MLEINFPLAGSFELIKINTCDDFLRFEVEGYTPGYDAPECNNPSSPLFGDPGIPAKYEFVKAYLVVNGNFEIELTDAQAELAFKVYEQEFFREMREQEKTDRDACELDRAQEDEYYKEMVR